MDKEIYIELSGVWFWVKINAKTGEIVKFDTRLKNRETLSSQEVEEINKEIQIIRSEIVRIQCENEGVNEND